MSHPPRTQPRTQPRTIVQKYGGSSVARPEQIREIASHLAQRHRQGDRLIAVVSAMGSTTDDLVRLAYSVSPTPNRRELDMLLTTGERVSMALLSMALHDLGCPAISFTGSQAGVLTDGAHSKARIIELRPTRVAEALEKGKIVVLAGFQGVHPHTKEITTLGRGGTDTTAVAMAAHFHAELCEIFKDVPGICSADPKVATGVINYRHLTYRAMAEMCFWGAKVLHYRSVELAAHLGVPVFIGSRDQRQNGTFLVTEDPPEGAMYENGKILAINSHHEVHHYTLPSEDLASAFRVWQKFLDTHQLPWPQILTAEWEGSSRVCHYWLTDTPEGLGALANYGRQTNVPFTFHGPPLSSVSVTCHNSVASDLARQIVDSLAAASIPVVRLLASPMSLSALVAPEHRVLAVQTLHNLVVQATP